MCQLLESIKVEDGIIFNLDYHQKRIDFSSKHFNQNGFKLSEIIIPQEYSCGLFKLRIIYSDNIEKIEFEKYKKKQVECLKIIISNTIEYNFKFANRVQLNELLSLRDDSDDIIIVKNGEFTDSSYSNLLFIKNGEYFTPISPLLKGTKRSYLIDNKIINPILITVKDLDKFEYCKIINSMIDIENSPIISKIIL